jgi:long-chain acyl-CoA synthetase
MNTHGNIAYASEIYRDVLDVDRDDVILGIAPLFHVTGLTGHIGLALAAQAPLVLAHRFDPPTVARLVERHRATITIAAITAYIALAADQRARAHDLSSLRTTYSGGAPIPPAVAHDLEASIGLRIRPVYGLTETTGPTQLAPREGPVPVHPDTGALAVGRTAAGTGLRIVDREGREVATGEAGEISLRGPQVVPGYWERPDETARAFPDGELRTGDVGVLDDDGWLYVVDRMKDMIVASGFKVWPREVEDVLYEHPDVREAAVVGVPDAYRGETVWAFVSVRPDAVVGEAELIAHCRARLAAYKYPRSVSILDELPKTSSGKILRRELRRLASDE